MNGKKATKAFAIAALATVVSIPTFAATRDQRGDNRGSRDQRGGYDSRSGNSRGSYDSNRNDNSGGNYERGNGQRNVQGRISSMSRYGDGYRVRLDRGNDWYYLPSSLWHGRRSSGLRVGLSIRLGAIFNSRGYYDVSSADWGYDDYGYGANRSLEGIVTRVDVRRGIAEVEDRDSGRIVLVEMRRDNGRGVDVNDLRSGDRVTLSGEWIGGGRFEAYRIDSVRSGRY